MVCVPSNDGRCLSSAALMSGAMWNLHRFAIEFSQLNRSGIPGMSFLAPLIARFSGAFKLARKLGCGRFRAAASVAQLWSSRVHRRLHRRPAHTPPDARPDVVHEPLDERVRWTEVADEELNRGAAVAALFRNRQRFVLGCKLQTLGNSGSNLFAKPKPVHFTRSSV